MIGCFDFNNIVFLGCGVLFTLHGILLSFLLVCSNRSLDRRSSRLHHLLAEQIAIIAHRAESRFVEFLLVFSDLIFLCIGIGGSNSFLARIEAWSGDSTSSSTVFISFFEGPFVEQHLLGQTFIFLLVVSQFAFQ